MSKILRFSVVSAAALVLFFAYGACAQTVRKEAVKIGDTAPDFTLSDASGKQINLYDAVKSAPVVLVFYRGSWCPFCVR